MVKIDIAKKGYLLD